MGKILPHLHARLKNPAYRDSEIRRQAIALGGLSLFLQDMLAVKDQRSVMEISLWQLQYCRRLQEQAKKQRRSRLHALYGVSSSE